MKSELGKTLEKFEDEIFSTMREFYKDIGKVESMEELKNTFHYLDKIHLYKLLNFLILFYS